MTRDNFDEDDHWAERRRDFDVKPTRTTAKWTARAWLIVALLVALAVATGAAIWALRVATSDVKGRGDAEIIKNEARNRIRAQEGFEALYQDIIAADKVINTTADALELDPASTRLKTELLGQKQYCVDLTGQYDAKARSFTQEEFRAADLPAQVNSTDPTTDCRENR